MKYTKSQISSFQSVVRTYYRTHKRSMPWRENYEPYWVLVSEVMLQQTQVSRVEPKFNEFITLFPTIESLAGAPLSQVLAAWSGLGYNRRTKYLQLAAQSIVDKHHGIIPQDVKDLVALPGIGSNTAGAIVAYAYNLPVSFVETNIRSVYLYHFFPTDNGISDKQILSVIEQTMDKVHPREWYWGLMDYGSHLKQTLGNNTDRSKHYVKQTAFVGSMRQLRGKVLKILVQSKANYTALSIAINDERLSKVIASLEQEGFIVQDQGFLRLR